MTTSRLVRAFHAATGVVEVPIGTPVEDLDPEVMRLRANLIIEEAGEVVTALGYPRTASVLTYALTLLERENSNLPDLVEIADGLADLDYVTAGAALVLGIPHDKIVREVHWSNMTKVDARGRVIKRPDGKVMKPKTWQSPCIPFTLLTAEKGDEVSEVTWMPLRSLLARWAPYQEVVDGEPPVTWDEEAEARYGDPEDPDAGTNLRRLLADIKVRGIRPPRAGEDPIRLGDDGLVHDGHLRILAARDSGTVADVPVVFEAAA